MRIFDRARFNKYVTVAALPENVAGRRLFKFSAEKFFTSIPSPTLIQFSA